MLLHPPIPIKRRRNIFFEIETPIVWLEIDSLCTTPVKTNQHVYPMQWPILDLEIVLETSKYMLFGFSFESYDCREDIKKEKKGMDYEKQFLR